MKRSIYKYNKYTYFHYIYISNSRYLLIINRAYQTSTRNEEKKKLKRVPIPQFRPFLETKKEVQTPKPLTSAKKAIDVHLITRN